MAAALCDVSQPSPEMKVVGLGLVNILTACYPGMMFPHQDGLLQVSEGFEEEKKGLSLNVCMFRKKKEMMRKGGRLGCSASRGRGTGVGCVFSFFP